MRVLITGGCGFIGHHIVEHLIKKTDWHIVVWDKLNYAASGFDRLRDINCFSHKRVSVLTVDFTHPISEGVIRETGHVDYLLHLGAETHVDRSIDDPAPFVMSNVVGTMHILDYARPVKELKGFSKVWLEPGETRAVSFTLGYDELKMLDRDLNWVVEPGEFRVMLGSSSQDIRLEGILLVE